MQQVREALDQVKALYEKVLGKPAPEIAPGSYVSFPPGVDPVDHAVKEVDQLRQLSEHLTLAPRPAAWTPPADAFLSHDAYLLRLEIPAVDRDTLEVFVVGGECVVRGQRNAPEVSPDLRPLGLERAWGPFERRFPLPQGSRSDRIGARYADGVLEVRAAIEGIEAPEETKVEVA